MMPQELREDRRQSGRTRRWISMPSRSGAALLAMALAFGPAIGDQPSWGSAKRNEGTPGALGTFDASLTSRLLGDLAAGRNVAPAVAELKRQRGVADHDPVLRSPVARLSPEQRLLVMARKALQDVRSLARDEPDRETDQSLTDAGARALVDQVASRILLARLLLTQQIERIAHFPDAGGAAKRAREARFEYRVQPVEQGLAWLRDRQTAARSGKEAKGALVTDRTPLAAMVHALESADVDRARRVLGMELPYHRPRFGQRSPRAESSVVPSYARDLVPPEPDDFMDPDGLAPAMVPGIVGSHVDQIDLSGYSHSWGTKYNSPTPMPSSFCYRMK